MFTCASSHSNKSLHAKDCAVGISRQLSAGVALNTFVFRNVLRATHAEVHAASVTPQADESL